MRYLISLITLFLFVAQDDPARQARELVEKLRSERIQDREDASRKLKELGKLAVPQLERAANDADPEVAARARRVLMAFTLSQTLPPTLLKSRLGIEDRLASGELTAWTREFMEVASKESLLVRRVGLEVLAGRAVQGAQTEETQLAICKILERQPCRAAFPPLIKLIEDGNPNVRRRVISLLGFLGVRDAIPRIMRYLDPKDPALCQTAAVALGRLGAKEAVPAIRQLLDSESPHVRRTGVYALAELGVNDVIQDIVEDLKSQDHHDRYRAVEVLARNGVSQAVPEIRKLLKDPNEIVRMNAVQGLGILRAPEAVPDLVELLADKDGNQRHRASAALYRIGARDAVPQIRKLLDHRDEEVRQQAVELLRHLDAKEAVPDIIKSLKAGDSTLRGSAVLALGDLGAEHAAGTLRTLLVEDPESRVRAYCATALASLGIRESHGEIATLLKDKNYLARNCAARALGRLGAKEETPMLSSLLEDKNEYVRMAALRALGDLDARDVASSIRPLLADGVPDVRKAAAAALCRLGIRDGAGVLLEEYAGPHTFADRLLPLNALRHREIWLRLERTPASDLPHGSRIEVLAAVAKRISLTLQSTLSEGEARMSGLPYLLDCRIPRGESLLTALEWYLTDEVIIEPEVMRIVSRGEAMKSWKAWWGEEQKKEKK